MAKLTIEDKIRKVIESLILPIYPKIYDYEIVKQDNQNYQGWFVYFYVENKEDYDMYEDAEIMGKMQEFSRKILNLRLYQLPSFVIYEPRKDEELPFDEKVGDNIRERTFSENVDEMDLKWHWDEQDRIVTPLHKTDWMLQFDNELPITLIEGKEYFIPVGVYHRVIKGSGDLKLQVKFL